MKKHVIEGIVKRHPDGFGFLIPDDPEHQDVYIPRHSMQGVMTNDRVQASVERSKSDNRYSGEIVKVTRRATEKLLGILHIHNQNGLILDDENRWGSNLFIHKSALKGAKDGELVIAAIDSFPGSKEGFVGHVVEVLGDAADPLVDARRVLIAHSIPTEFSAETLKEAKAYRPEVDQKDFQGRKDLRDLPFVTIDGETAKDFDDAICVQSNNRGFQVWVGIADVSHYVPKGSAIDRDAYERGNSTYFPHFVIPMLPEILSNELCSLRPHIPRLSLVAEMQLDFKGEVLKADFYEAVIMSHHRLTYGKAQDMIDGHSDPKYKDVEEMVLRAADVAKILMAKRFKEGSLDLDIPQSQIILDDAGHPIDISKSERLFSHRLIEELMLLANVCVGEFLERRQIPAIYRVHDVPDVENLRTLEMFLHNFGGKSKKLVGSKLQKRLTKALQEFEDRPEAQILNILTLRSMKQAEYNPENIGHFGLGFRTYTHFTSPIRRYSDLIVHRLVKSLILKSDKKTAGYRYSENELATAGLHLSACEQRSAKAERQFHAIKRARFMSQRLGQEFEGIISSVTKFGIFVLLRAFDVDGLVKLDQLGGDHFVFDEDRLQLVGKKTKRVFKIGDIVTIQVAGTNIEAGQIDFVLAGETQSAPVHDRKTDRKDHKERRPSQNHRRRDGKKRVSARRRKG